SRYSPMAARSSRARATWTRRGRCTPSILELSTERLVAMSIGIEKSKTRASVRRNGAAWPQEPFEFPPSRHWRLSVAQYHGMINAGLLTEHDRVELLEGMLIAKM